MTRQVLIEYLTSWRLLAASWRALLRGSVRDVLRDVVLVVDRLLLVLARIVRFHVVLEAE